MQIYLFAALLTTFAYYQHGTISNLWSHQERPETPPSPSLLIPFPQDPDFVERGVSFDQINQKCAVPGSWTALVGLGGVGKSQLAIEYAYRTRERSPETWVFWVHASSAARFEQSFRDITDCVKIPGRQDSKANIFKLVHDWLRGSKRQWVLILDNVDDASFLLEAQRTSRDGQTNGGNSRPLLSYLPQGQNGSILITTRTKEVARKLVVQRNIITVGTMNKTDALALFEKKLEAQEDGNDIAELAAALEFMPLAIVQAAAYISDREPLCSVKQYLNDFRTLLDHNEEGVKGFRRDYEAKNSIVITWQISFDHIRQTNQSAADLLSLMSFFDRQGIPEDVLRNRSEHGDSQQNLDKDGILKLRNYSFISINKGGKTFEIHSLVQLGTQKWLMAHGQLERWKQQFVRNLCVEFPTGDHENWVRCQLLFPHAKSAAVQRLEGEESLAEWASLLYYAAWYAWRKGSIADAEMMAVKSLKARKEVFGQEHKDTLSSMGMVGLIYSLEGRWKEAEELFVQVMETRKRVLGPEHPSTLGCMNKRRMLYMKRHVAWPVQHKVA